MQATLHSIPAAAAGLVTQALATLGAPQEVLVKRGLRYFQVFTENGIFAHGAVPADEPAVFPDVESDEDMGQAHILLAIEQLTGKGWELDARTLVTGALSLKVSGGERGKLGIQLEPQDMEFALYCAPWLDQYWH